MTETQYLLTVIGGLFAVSSALIVWAFNRLDSSVRAARTELHTVRLEVAELRGQHRERNEVLHHNMNKALARAPS